MQADHVLRPLRRGRDAVDILVRGIGGENRALPAHGVEFREYLLLEFEVLEHGLDDEVRAGQRFVVCRPCNPPAARERLILAHLAALDAPLVIAVDDSQALAERLIVHFEQ